MLKLYYITAEFLLNENIFLVIKPTLTVNSMIVLLIAMVHPGKYLGVSCSDSKQLHSCIPGITFKPSESYSMPKYFLNSPTAHSDCINILKKISHTIAVFGEGATE